MSLRRPRCYLGIRGGLIPCESVEVSRSAERSADTFSATFSATDAERRAGLTLADWADFQPTDVDILAALGLGEAPAVIVSGRVDEPEIAWKTLTITVSGRDNSARLVEKRRSQNFVNRSAKDVVEQIAKDHGLTAEVSGAEAKAGKKFDRDSAYLALNRPDYDILNDLAERTGCRWFVEGKTLFFESKGADAGTFRVLWQPPGVAAAHAVADALDLRTKRNMTAARPIEMNVRSWHHQDKEEHEAQEKLDGVGDPLVYEHHHNGRRREEVEEIARSRARNAKRHQYAIDLSMPADLSVTPRQRLELAGTGTVYDQTYEIDSVSFEISWAEGALMEIAARSAGDGQGGGQGGQGGDQGAGSGASAAPSVPVPPARPPGL